MGTRLPTLLLTLALGAPAPAAAQGAGEAPPAGDTAPGEAPAPDPADQDARELFFEGLDLQEAGQWEPAADLFRRALQLQPELHQARLRLAECEYELGNELDALAQLELYLNADFPGAEVGRARLLVVACGADPDVLIAGGAGDDGRRRPADVRWAPARLEIGAALVHFENDIALTAGGPVLAMRFLPIQYLELTAQVRGAFGPYPDHEGVVAVVDFGPGVDASVPLGPTRLLAGVVVPFLLSRYGGEVRVDAGVVAELGVRVPVGDSPLVLGVQLEGGYLVTPTVGGSLRFGFQLGPWGDAAEGEAR